MVKPTLNAHYGTRDWLAQRITAVVMAVYTLVFLGIALYYGGISYDLWLTLFDCQSFKLGTFLFALSLFYHAWVGMRNIWMDYVRPVGLRLSFQSLTLLVLIGYVGWVIQILWGQR